VKYAESHTHRLVQPSTVDELFGRLGAKPEAVNVDEPVVPEAMQVRCKRIVRSLRRPTLTRVVADDGDWAGVLPVLHALQNISAGYAVLSSRGPSRS